MIHHLAERIEYAKDELAWLEAGAKEGEEPWRGYELYSPQHGKWIDATGPVSWISTVNYRRRPKLIHAIDAKGVEHKFPPPIREALTRGKLYWFVAAEGNALQECQWRDDHFDRKWLSLGLCQATEEGAQMQLAAIRAICRGGE